MFGNWKCLAWIGAKNSHNKAQQLHTNLIQSNTNSSPQTFLPVVCDTLTSGALDVELSQASRD